MEANKGRIAAKKLVHPSRNVKPIIRTAKNLMSKNSAIIAESNGLSSSKDWKTI